MSAVSGERTAQLTTQALLKIWNEESFKDFCQTILKKKDPVTDISEPEVPRERTAQARYEVGEGAPWHPETSEDLYRKIYFEALDLIISATGERFDLPSFKSYVHLESVMVKALKSENISSELAYVRRCYADNIRYEYFVPQLEVFKVLMKGKSLDCLTDV